MRLPSVPSTQASPLLARTMSKAKFFLSDSSSLSSNRLPISLFVAWNVFLGLVTVCLLAGSPTSLSPSLVKAMTEGVVRLPSLFSMTWARSPSMTATQELVVPRTGPETCCLRVAEEARERLRLRPRKGRRESILFYGFLYFCRLVCCLARCLLKSGRDI